MSDVKSISLGVLGLAITTFLLYIYAWDIPWLMIFTGMYLLGIAFGYAWNKWVDYPGWIMLVVELFTVLIGILMAVNVRVDILIKQWYPIPYAPPFYVLLLCILIGTGIYIIADAVKHQ